MNFYSKTIPKGKTRRVIQVFFAHVRKYPWLNLGAYSAIFSLMALQVLVPIYYKKLIDTAISASSPTSEAVHALFLVLMALFAVKRSAMRESQSFLWIS